MLVAVVAADLRVPDEPGQIEPAAAKLRLEPLDARVFDCWPSRTQFNSSTVKTGASFSSRIRSTKYSWSVCSP
jgi:hypothetical protein